MPRPPLADAVQSALTGHQGTIGLVVARLDGSASTDLNPDRRFRAASLYKLFLLSSAMAAIEAGTLDPNETLTVDQTLIASDPYADFLPGTRLTVDCALRTMIEMSGNSAADLFEQRLGLATINAHIRALGLTQSSVSADTAFTSPRDMATLLGAIGRGEAVSKIASQRMLELLTNQQQNDRVPVPLPLEVRVGHKTGELPGLRHDAALVFAPSGAYVLAALVQDAPDEAEARSTIVDLSRAAYTAFEPGGVPRVLGLPPRLAREVFRLTDAQGRMALLADPRTETVRLAAHGIALADGADDARLRPEALPDLSALQQAAQAGGQSLRVKSGFLRPTQAEAEHALPAAWLQPCALQQPPLSPELADTDEPPTGLQHWLGTVVTFSDDADHWLLDHAPDYGFVPSLPEAGTAAAFEPRTWRWVGQPMAARIQPFVGAADYPDHLRAELQRALADLQSPEPTFWGQQDRCWTIPTLTGRGCASRWYFLPLPGF